MKKLIARDAIDAIAHSARSRCLVVFTGAGVSMLAPSKSPSWWEIYVAATRALGARFYEAFPQLARDLDIDQLLRPLRTQQLSDLIVARFAGEEFVETLGVVDIADPNENHVLVAALAATGALRGVVTTNFDTLFERAAAVGGTRFQVVTPFARALEGISTTLTPLLKIHGSAINPLKLIETSAHKAREIDTDLVEHWRDVLRDADLLVLGYSGADLGFGAAREFFEDFLKLGRRIWWLHLPGFAPELTGAVETRAELIEGTLPEFLRDVAQAMGVGAFAVPLSGADAQAALTREMEHWSRKPHIGKWSAAVFFFALGELHDQALSYLAQHRGERFRGSRLHEGLAALALETAARFAPGSAVDISDLGGVGGFLCFAGCEALSRIAAEDAEPLLRSAVNVFSLMHRVLSKTANAHHSESERHMNLSSAWNNYAHALLFIGDDAKAVEAFRTSMSHAYLGGIASSFLVALGNILRFGLDNSAIRRCMQIVEGAIRVADRIGAVQSSIELRILLAGYHIDRHELWAAAAALGEARRRAATTHNEVMVAMIQSLEGHLLIRRGQFRNGVALIVMARSELDGRAMLGRETSALWNTLKILDSDKDAMEWLRDAAEVEQIVGRAESEIEAARREDRLPWDGKLFRLHRSAAIGETDTHILVELAKAELAGNAESAAQVGLALARRLLETGHIRDAAWAVGNALANPYTLPAHRALAHALIAATHAELDLLDDVEPHLQEALTLYRGVGMPVPPGATVTGLWYSIQAGQVLRAVDWAKQLVETIVDAQAMAAFVTTTVLQIDSWGEAMAPVAEAMREAFQRRFGWSLQARSTSAPTEAWRRFHGTNVELQRDANDNAHTAVVDAQEKLSRGDADGALERLDELSKGSELSDHIAGLVLSLQIQALVHRATPSQIDEAMDAQRENLLERLAFSALSRLEATVARSAVSKGDAALAFTVMSKRAFVADLAADPRAASTLRFWQAHVPDSIIGSASSSFQIRAAQLSARFYCTVESLLVENRPVAVHERPTPDDTQAIWNRYLESLKASEDAAQADKVYQEAVAACMAVQALTPLLAARLRGERANWALRTARWIEAIGLYREVERELRALNDIHGALNSMAGEARALSRSGAHADAVTVFERAIGEAGKRPIAANLLAGLAAAHVLKATEGNDPADAALLDQAIETYRRAIASTAAGGIDCALARLGLARALGQRGEQEAAMGELDRAIADFAHMGSPTARSLIENRALLAKGMWTALSLR